MDCDEAFRQCAAALWALAGAVRSGSGGQQDVAAADAVAALSAARGGEHFLIVHEADGSLHVNGRRLSYDADSFEPASGLVRLFRARGVGEVLFDPGCGPQQLVPWMAAFVGGAAAVDLEGPGGGAIHVGLRDPEQVPPLAVPRGSAATGGESRLGATFLVHTLVAALGPVPYVPPRMARLVVTAVVDHLFAHGGPEPLAALQGGGGDLRRGLQVGVYSVLVGRAAGWPEEHLAGLALAGVLHGVGESLDRHGPAAAGLRWMLAHGCADPWLRSALVQRLWRADHGHALAGLPPEDDLGAAIVSCAVAIEAAGCAGCDLALVRRRLLADSARGRFPAELAVAACAMMGDLAPAA